MHQKSSRHTPESTESNPIFNFESARFRYSPFPIGVIRPFFTAEHYDRLLATFPPLELFKSHSKVGRKFILSEKFHGRQYHDYVRSVPEWSEFHRYIKSRKFILDTLEMLRHHRIDIGYAHYPVTMGRRAQTLLRDLGRGRWPRFDQNLHARFQFTVLPADGGCVTPHTDSPGKVVTFVLSMVGEKEWDPELGGGTDVLRVLDDSRSFNYLNRKLGFGDVEILETFPFEPNQAVVFVKTFNSWHSVSPMTGHASGLLRKALTINIEERDRGNS